MPPIYVTWPLASGKIHAHAGRMEDRARFRFALAPSREIDRGDATWPSSALIVTRARARHSSGQILRESCRSPLPTVL